jgi:hypothetical protein
MNDCYVKLKGNPTYWLVLDGERKAVSGPTEMYAYGLKPVHTVSAEELEAIPIKGRRRKPPKVSED